VNKHLLLNYALSDTDCLHNLFALPSDNSQRFFSEVVKSAPMSTEPVPLCDVTDEIRLQQCFSKRVAREDYK
jgi:hypothetical protein